MNTYLITTTWSAGPRVTFKREHTRYAKTKASALAQERAHNKRDEPIMKLDQLPGDRPWKWKITGAKQIRYQPLTAAGKAKRAGEAFEVFMKKPGRKRRKTRKAHRCSACGR